MKQIEKQITTHVYLPNYYMDYEYLFILQNKKKTEGSVVSFGKMTRFINKSEWMTYKNILNKQIVYLYTHMYVCVFVYIYMSMVLTSFVFIVFWLN